MIQSFKDDRTAQIWAGKQVKKLPADLQQKALKRLTFLNLAKSLTDLYIPPSNRFHKLEGVERYSIRRITFTWSDAGPADVHFEDYHLSNGPRAGPEPAPVPPVYQKQPMKTHPRIPFPHPGQIIREDFLEDYGLNQADLARALDIPASRMTEIIKGRRAITADTAVRLARFFGNRADFWLGLQAEYDLRHTDSAAISKSVKPHPKVKELAFA
jgi:addiction module HigA family antidote